MKRHNIYRSDITKDTFEQSDYNPDLYETYGQAAASLAYELYTKGDARAASFLCAVAKKKSGVDDIKAAAKEYGNLFIGLSSSEPKMRKNTARLLGAVKEIGADIALSDALTKETVRMVIPSMLLALGVQGTETAHNALTAYKILPARDYTEIKHEREARDALGKALSMYVKAEKHVFTGFERIRTLRLVCAKGMGKYVSCDCKRAGVPVISYANSSVTVGGCSLENLYTVRSFREVLLPVCKSEESLLVAKERILCLLDSTHKRDERPYSYRIEYRADGDRRREIAKYTAAFNCERLVNSVSDYETEIRIENDGAISLKLFSYEDTRFGYRKESLPASISPANAAAVMSFARQYLTENAVVLDMCAGSGTMLFERQKALPVSQLIGVDISEKAVQAAKKNAKAAYPSALFYHADLRKFTLRKKVDEVISNLPFGNRVGTHSVNTELYADIAKKVDEWMKYGGICILYTMEHRLIKKCFKENGSFELLCEITTEAGGLLPAVLIYRKKFCADK